MSFYHFNIKFSNKKRTSEVCNDNMINTIA